MPYRPRSLGISAPAGKDVHEVYLEVVSVPSILAKISNLMGKRNIDIIGVHGQASDDKKTFYAIFYAELGGAAASIEDLLDELRKQDYVFKALSQPRAKEYFESMMFPLTSGGHHRVFVLSARSWIALVKSLIKTFGTPGKVILHNQGVSVGEQLVGRIEGRFHGKSVDRELMTSNLKGLFLASGLGMLDLSPASDGFRVAIREPIVFDSADSIIDDFVVGVTKGAMGRIYSKDYSVTNLVYEGSEVRFDLHGG